MAVKSTDPTFTPITNSICQSIGERETAHPIDGAKWDLYEQNLFSENHIFYGGYGGIGYYGSSTSRFLAESYFML